jgi:hypothetical protein
MEVGGATSSCPARVGSRYRRFQLRTDSGGTVRTSVHIGNRWRDRPPGRASGQVERRARATALRNVPRRGTKPMEDEVSCVRQRSCGASTRQRSNASKAAVSRGGGCEGPATDRRSFALGTRRKNAWRSASADSSPSVFSALPIPGSWCAQARRVLRSVRATERQGGNGRGDTVRLLARESSGGMNASRGRGECALGTRRQRLVVSHPPPKRAEPQSVAGCNTPATLSDPKSDPCRTRSGAVRGANRRGGVKPRGRNVSRAALAGTRGRCRSRVIGRGGS